MKNAIHRFVRSDADIAVLRLSVIFIFALFGTFKWFEFEVRELEPLISSTWLSFLYTLFGVHGGSYFLGVVESAAFLALLVGFKKPVFGIVGAAIVIVTGITTLSLLPQLPMVDSFIVKDVLLIGGGAVLLKFDLRRHWALLQPSAIDSASALTAQGLR